MNNIEYDRRKKTNKEVSTRKIYGLANAIQGQNCTISAQHNAIYICNFSNETPWIIRGQA